MNSFENDNYGLTTTEQRPTGIANPFGGSGLPSAASNVANVQAASREFAEMQAQIYLAKQFPRDEREAMERILTACQRPGLAQSALYSYARGGSEISGPSIRLAEEIARDWGNIECGWNELERGKTSSKLMTYAWDKQTNVYKKLVFVVSHMRNTKKGSYPITDERDLYELLANNASRRMRACILALIPGDVVDAACEQCQQTLRASCDATEENVKRLVDAFLEIGVTKRQIEKRIQRQINTIAPAQVISLRKIYASLRDEMSSIEDWFDVEEEQTKSATDKLKAAIVGGKKQAAPKAKRAVASATTAPTSNGNDQPPTQRRLDLEPETESESTERKAAFDPVDVNSSFDAIRRAIATSSTDAEFANATDAATAKINAGMLSDDDKETLFELIDQKEAEFAARG